MRAKLVTIVIAVFAAAPLGFQFSANAAHRPEGVRASNPAAESSIVQRRVRRRAATMKGVPKGVDKCIEHLMEMAAEEPMTPYEGHPQEIINDGLLWNDPKSKCSVGDNHDLRLKIIEMAKAWRMNDAAKVRSLLDEIKQAAT